MRTRLIERLKEGLDDESSFKMMTSVYTALQELEQQGWCFMSSPVATQSSSIATPILNDEGAEFALAALAVGPAEVAEKLREAVAPELLRVAGAIAKALKRM
jgi:DNA-binding IclR family transcriptional regulator